MTLDRYKIISANRRKRLFKHVFAMLITCFLFFGSLSYIVPFFIDWDDYRVEIQENMEFILDAKVNIAGGIKGSLFFPTVDVYRVRISSSGNEVLNVSTIERIEMRLSFLSTLLFTPKVKEVIIHGGNFIGSNFYQMLFNNEKGKGGLSARVDHVTIKDSKIAIPLSNFVNAIELKSLDISVGKESHIVGKLSISGNMYDVSWHSDKNSNISYTLDSLATHLQFEMKENVGKMTGSGSNILSLVADLLGYRAVDKNDAPFTISSSVELSEGIFKINNFVLDSEPIKLGVHVNFEHNKHDVKVTVFSLDLDRMLDFDSTYENEVGFLNKDREAYLEYLDGVIPKEFYGNFLISAKTINYRGEEIKELVAEAVMDSGKVDISTARVMLPGNTLFELKGAITSDNIHSKFDGVVKMVGDSASQTIGWATSVEKSSDKDEVLYLYSKVLMLPHLVVFSGLNVNIGDSKLAGDLKINNDRRGNNISGSIVGEKIIFDDYNIKFLNGINSAAKLESSVDIEFMFHDFMFNDKMFNSVDFVLDSNQKILTINNISVDSEDIKFNGNIKLDNSNIRTITDVYIRGKSFDTSILGWTTLMEVVASENYESGNNEVKWSDKPIAWFGMQDMDGNVNIAVENVKTEKFAFNNLVMDLSLKNRAMTVNKMEFGMDGGAINIVGNVGMEDISSLSLSFAANNMNMSTIFDQLLNVQSLKGRFSCSGTFRARGEHPSIMVKNSTGKINFSFREVVANGLNVDTLIDRLFDVNNKAELANLTQVILFEGENKFHSLDGSANISGGVMASSLRFLTPRSSGVLSLNFSLAHFAVNSVLRFFFVLPRKNDETLSIDMNMQGALWRPKIFFDNEKLYNLLVSKRY